MASIGEHGLPAVAPTSGQRPRIADQPPKQTITPGISLVSGAIGGAMEAAVTVRFEHLVLPYPMHIPNTSLVSFRIRQNTRPVEPQRHWGKCCSAEEPTRRNIANCTTGRLPCHLYGMFYFNFGELQQIHCPVWPC